MKTQLWRERVIVIVLTIVLSSMAAMFGQQPIDISVPSGTIVYRNSTTCWTGWTEFTSARGNYIVGLLSGGTLNTQVGTALTNQENRTTGQHNHTENAHNHAITDPGHFHTEEGWNGASGAQNSAGSSGELPTAATTGNATTGITINNATATLQNQGSVAGTNAPYLQWIVCQKS